LLSALGGIGLCIGTCFLVRWLKRRKEIKRQQANKVTVVLIPDNRNYQKVLSTDVGV